MDNKETTVKHLPTRHDQKKHGKTNSILSTGGVVGVKIGSGKTVVVDRFKKDFFKQIAREGQHRALIYDTRTKKVLSGHSHEEALNDYAKEIGENYNDLMDRSVRLWANPEFGDLYANTATAGNIRLLGDEDRSLRNLYHAIDRLRSLGMRLETRVTIVTATKAIKTSLEKHLPTRHNQLDHGRKRRVYQLSEIMTSDIDKWEDYVKQGASRSQDMAASLARSALHDKDSFESITRVLRDDSGEAQSFFHIESRYGDKAAYQFEKYGYNDVADGIGPNEQIHVLQYLGTAPWHLESEGVSGWGAAALYESVKYVLEDGGKRMMLLSANPLSSEFYDKVGMQRVDNEFEGQTPFEFGVKGMQAYMREYEIRHVELRQADYSGFSKSLAY